MDDLYIEPLFKSEKLTKQRLEAFPSLDVPKLAVAKEEPLFQLSYSLDQLEKAIARECENFLDFQFIFQAMRKKLKEKKEESILGHLTELEELLDISLGLL